MIISMQVLRFHLLELEKVFTSIYQIDFSYIFTQAWHLTSRLQMSDGSVCSKFVLLSSISTYHLYIFVYLCILRHVSGRYHMHSCSIIVIINRKLRSFSSVDFELQIKIVILSLMFLPACLHQRIDHNQLIGHLSELNECTSFLRKYSILW